MAGAVLFDLFETLVSEYPDELTGPPRWGRPAQELGLDEDRFRQAWRAQQGRRMTSELGYAGALAEICEAEGVVPPAGVIDELLALRQSHRAEVFATVDDRIVRMLDELRAAGVAIAVVSNCSVEETVHLAGSVLAPRFDAVVWSCVEGVQKPAPEIYRRACDRLGVGPGEATFVGDGSFDELRGAAAAGVAPVWASWFTRRWPAELAARRRQEVEGAAEPVPEATAPTDVVRFVLGRSSSVGHR